MVARLDMLASALDLDVYYYQKNKINVDLEYKLLYTSCDYLFSNKKSRENRKIKLV
jgi:hypothetical protein